VGATSNGPIFKLNFARSSNGEPLRAREKVGPLVLALLATTIVEEGSHSTCFSILYILRFPKFSKE